MIGVIVIKILLLSLMWTLGWCFYFAQHNAETDLKNISIAGAPWIVMFIYIMLFWW
jgi:hypothetical protein